jgi:hypothetical protein
MRRLTSGRKKLEGKRLLASKTEVLSGQSTMGDCRIGFDLQALCWISRKAFTHLKMFPLHARTGFSENGDKERMNFGAVVGGDRKQIAECRQLLNSLPDRKYLSVVGSSLPSIQARLFRGHLQFGFRLNHSRPALQHFR